MSSIRLGMVTIGQAPRDDVVPKMANLLGPDVAVLEAGALDGLSRAEVAALAPGDGDDILVTRLADGGSVFIAKRHVVPRVEAAIAALEEQDVACTVLLCTGVFPGLAARRPLLTPQPLLLGLLRATSFPGRLGVLTPSVPHVPQTEARWRLDGFDPLVVPLSPYETGDPAAVGPAVAALRSGGAGLVVMDCMGFSRKTRDEMAERLGLPVLVANLLVARVAAELLGR